MSPQVVVTVATKVLPAAVALCGSVAVRAPGAAGGRVQPATRAPSEAAAWRAVARGVAVGGRRSSVAAHGQADAATAADHQQHGQDDRDDLAVAPRLGLVPLPGGLLLLVAALGALSLAVVRRHLMHSVPAAASGGLPLTAVSLGATAGPGRAVVGCRCPCRPLGSPSC